MQKKKSPDMITNQVQARMASIMKLFMEARTLAENTADLIVLENQLEHTDVHYRSVAYEAASMTIALRDFENEGKLKSWNDFATRNGQKHASQIHAGLGWAIAQKNIPAAGILENLNELMRARVADGCGYYEGIFRQQSSLIHKIVPADFAGHLEGYDQGIGRSIYYSTKGDIEKIPGIISAFPIARQASLWRGVSIACTYVGGSDEKTLQSIYEFSGEYKVQLKVGASLVARARYDAGSVTTDIQTACISWCKRNYSELVAITKKAEKEIMATAGSYLLWLNMIAGELPQ